MKVIKHLKHQTPHQRLKIFFKEIPLLTKILVSHIFTVSFLTIIIIPDDDLSHLNIGFLSIIKVRPIFELIVFVVLAMSDFNRQQKKGSLPFLLSFIFKTLILGFSSFAIDKFFVDFLQFQSLAQMNITGWPMMYLLSLMIRDIITEPDSQRYLFCQPFHLKALYYPLFVLLMLELIHFRIDLIYIFVVTMLMYIIKFDCILRKVCAKIDDKILNQKMIEFGLISMSGYEGENGQIDRVVTNSSIILEQK